LSKPIQHEMINSFKLSRPENHGAHLRKEQRLDPGSERFGVGIELDGGCFCGWNKYEHLSVGHKVGVCVQKFVEAGVVEGFRGFWGVDQVLVGDGEE